MSAASTRRPPSRSPPSSSALEEIPLEPEQISREWLFEVINQYRHTRGLTLLSDPNDILDCSIDECERSHGHLSTTYKLVANFALGGSVAAVADSDSDSDPSLSPNSSYAFFLKMLPGTEPRHLRLVRETRAFSREVEAHFSLLPAVRLFVEENESANGRSAGRVGAAPCPQIVYGAYDDEDGAGIIVLMDLNESGYFPLSHYVGFNLPQLLTVVEKVAEFHAVGSAMLISNQDVEKQFKVFQEHPQDADFVYETLSPLYKDLAKFLRRVPGYTFCHDALERERPHLARLLANSNRRRGVGGGRFPLRTVLHGDLWEKNVLLRFEPISEALDVVLCDWKSVRCGSPCSDLAFLMLACTSQGVRARSTKQVLEKYFLTYTETLRKFNINFSERFPKFGFDDFRADYEDSLLGAFLQAAIVMTREVRYLEAEFYNATENKEIEEFGCQLRCLGRRLLELAEEFIPELERHQKQQREKQKQQQGCLSSKQSSLKNGKTRKIRT